MAWQIRPFTDADFPAVARLLSVVQEEPVSEEALRWEESRISPPCKKDRWVAEEDGVLVGVAGYGQNHAFYHPQKFEVSVAVLPSHRRRGIGTALWRLVEESLQPYDPISLSAGTLESWADGMRFAERQGFAEKLRNWESHLAVQEFDPNPWLPTVEEVRAKGYEIKSLPELAEEPEYMHKLYALTMEVRRDIPSTDPWKDEPYEIWIKRVDNPHYFPEGHFIGLKDGEWVGLSALWRTEEEGVLHTGVTAVKREHRGSGLAKALKVRAILFGKERGARLIKTWNESNNHRMLAINMKMGFERKPAWVLFTKEIKPNG